ncbi:DUF603 domain-containing protein [Borrelia hispanica]|uniref:DUF603 domain-containing protein n=1 Tax=Borrelia hispanica TaxID=40835 RepID=UPI000466ABE0|nr:DUF603 domain-containing protein [Borrelia hispanica]
MSKIKRGYEDYAMYFSEGQLSDTEIAKELGVSRANVCKMRQKWENIKDNPKEFFSESKVTICKTTLNSILDRVLETNAKARELKSQFSIAKSQLGLKFMRAFNNYLELELEDCIEEINLLEREIKMSKKKGNSRELQDKKIKLKDLKREKEDKTMKLCYETMKKLKIADLDESRFKFGG